MEKLRNKIVQYVVRGNSPEYFLDIQVLEQQSY